MLPESRIAGFVERPALGALLLDALLSPAARGGPPVALIGPGGYGKTHLAIWAARQVRDSFPDGVLWIQPPRDDVALPRLLCELTGLLKREDIPGYRHLPLAAAEFTQALAERRMLIVVDNVWETATVEAFRGGPHCVTLLTSRRRFPDHGHTEIRVGGMAAEEAAAILLRRTGIRSGEAVAQVAALAERCGYWPLPLSLLSGVLPGLLRRTSLTATVRDVLTGLDEYGLGSIDGFAAEAGTGIASALGLSLDHLAATSPHGEASRKRLRQLAAFPADQPVAFSLLERLWGLGAAAAQSECDRFFDHSLIEGHDAEGVRLHDPVREQLRHQEPALLRTTSGALLERCRPAAGWHDLAARPRDPLAAQLAAHLAQAGKAEELTALVRDLRHLTARVHLDGPAAAEADVRAALEAARAEAGDMTAADGPLAAIHRLAALLRADAHLLTASQSTATDVALRLHHRLFGQVDLTHLDEALPGIGLHPTAPVPGRDGPGPVRSLAGHTGQVSSVFWLSDGQVAGVGGDDGTFRRWDPATGAQTAHLPLDVGLVLRAWLSPDERHLAVLCQPRHGTALPLVEVVDVLSGQRVGRHPTALDSAVDQFLPGGLPTVAWSPDSRLLAQAHGRVVDIWSPFEERVLRTLPVPDPCMALDWHHEGGLACLTAYGRVAVWGDPMGGDAVHRATVTEYGEDIPRALAWSPDGRSIAVAADYAVAVITDRPDRRMPVRRGAHMGSHPCGISWRPDSQAFAIAANHVSAGSEVIVWEGVSDTDFVLKPIDLRQAGVLGLAWDSSGDLLAVAGADSAVRLWRPAASGAPALRNIRRKAGPWRAAEAASTRGEGPAVSQLLSLSGGGLTSYDIPAETAVRERDERQTVAVLPGARSLTAEWSDGGAFRWVMSSTQACQDARIAQAVAASTYGFPDVELTLRGTDGTPPPRQTWHRPRCLAIAPDRSRFALACENGDVQLFDSASLVRIAAINLDEIAEGAAFTPDGRQLVVAGSSHLHRLALTRAPTNRLPVP